MPITVSKTVDDAHREANQSVISAQWYKQLLLLIDAAADTTVADQSIIDAQQRVTDLTAQQAPPVDIVTATDTFFQAHRDNLVDAQTRLDTVANDPVLAPVLYPDDDPVAAIASLMLVQQQIASLDLVWTP